MKMYFYRGRRPNFGDELNSWLWPRLLPGFFDNDETGSCSIGVGSTLFDSTARVPQDRLWRWLRRLHRRSGDRRELAVLLRARGRLTAAALGLDAVLGVGDAAILVRSCVSLTARKAHPISFMPHWQSAADGQWAEGQPRRRPPLHRPVRHGRKRPDPISRSRRFLLPEAMHGAIVADALRVPWIAVRPIQTALNQRVGRLGVGAGRHPPLGARGALNAWAGDEPHRTQQATCGRHP